MSLSHGTVKLMDVSNASYYVIKKMEMKVAKWGTPKKFKKTVCFANVISQ
jgi:hypothetical protein